MVRECWLRLLEREGVRRVGRSGGLRGGWVWSFVVGCMAEGFGVGLVGLEDTAGFVDRLAARLRRLVVEHYSEQIEGVVRDIWVARQPHVVAV